MTTSINPFDLSSRELLGVMEQEERQAKVERFLGGGYSALSLAERAVAAWMDSNDAAGKAERLATDYGINQSLVERGDKPWEDMNEQLAEYHRLRTEAVVQERQAADFGAIAFAAHLVEQAENTKK